VINLSTSFLVGDKVKFWFPCNHCVLVVRCCSWFCLYVPGGPWAISFLWNFVSGTLNCKFVSLQLQTCFFGDRNTCPFPSLLDQQSYGFC
jgi:hypothetical protein